MDETTAAQPQTVQENTPPNTLPVQKKSFRKKLIISIVLIVLLLGAIGSALYFAFYKPNSQTTTIQPVQTGPKLGISSYDRSTRIINLKIDQAVIEKAKQKYTVKKSGFIPIQRAYAQESQPMGVYRIYQSLIGSEDARSIAETFGFQDSDFMTNLNSLHNEVDWKKDDKTLSIQGFGYTFTDSSNSSGEKISETQAKQAAETFLNDFPVVKDLDNYKISNGENCFINGDTCDFNFTKTHNGIPVWFTYPGPPKNSNLAVTVNNSGKVTRYTNQNFGSRIEATETLSFDEKGVDEAASEFEQTGGYVNWVELLPGQAWSSTEKLEIKDATVSDIQKGYLYFDNTGYAYPADLADKNVGYLIPVWVITGEGNVFGKQITGEKLKFTSMIYAIKETAGTPTIFGIRSLDVSSTEAKNNSNVTASFNFVFSNLKSEGNYYPNPGLHYKLEVTYPNGEYSSVSDLIRESSYGEIIDIPTGSSNGEMKIKLSLVDFPAISAEKTITITDDPKVSTDGTLMGGVYVSSTGEPVKDTTIVLQDQNGERMEVKNNEAGEFTFTNLTLGNYTISAFTSDGGLLKEEQVKILSPEQNMQLFQRVETYINIGIDPETKVQEN